MFDNLTSQGGGEGESDHRQPTVSERLTGVRNAQCEGYLARVRGILQAQLGRNLKKLQAEQDNVKHEHQMMQFVQHTTALNELQQMFPETDFSYQSCALQRASSYKTHDPYDCCYLRRGNLLPTSRLHTNPLALTPAVVKVRKILKERDRQLKMEARRESRLHRKSTSSTKTSSPTKKLDLTSISPHDDKKQNGHQQQNTLSQTSASQNKTKTAFTINQQKRNLALINAKIRETKMGKVSNDANEKHPVQKGRETESHKLQPRIKLPIAKNRSNTTQKNGNAGDNIVMNDKKITPRVSVVKSPSEKRPTTKISNEGNTSINEKKVTPQISVVKSPPKKGSTNDGNINEEKITPQISVVESPPEESSSNVNIFINEKNITKKHQPGKFRRSSRKSTAGEPASQNILQVAPLGMVKEEESERDVDEDDEPNVELEKYSPSDDKTSGFTSTRATTLTPLHSPSRSSRLTHVNTQHSNESVFTSTSRLDIRPEDAATRSTKKGSLHSLTRSKLFSEDLEDLMERESYDDESTLQEMFQTEQVSMDLLARAGIKLKVVNNIRPEVKPKKTPRPVTRNLTANLNRDLSARVNDFLTKLDREKMEMEREKDNIDKGHHRSHNKQPEIHKYKSLQSIKSHIVRGKWKNAADRLIKSHRLSITGGGMSSILNTRTSMVSSTSSMAQQLVSLTPPTTGDIRAQGSSSTTRKDSVEIREAPPPVKNKHYFMANLVERLMIMKKAGLELPK